MSVGAAEVGHAPSVVSHAHYFTPLFPLSEKKKRKKVQRIPLTYPIIQHGSFDIDNYHSYTARTESIYVESTIVCTPSGRKYE